MVVMSDQNPRTLPDVALEVRRNWLASLLFGLFRPADAKAAEVNERALVLTFVSTSKTMPLGDIKTVEIEHVRYWSGVQVDCASRKLLISGLTSRDTAALSEALEAARTCWWQDAIATRVEPLQSVHDRLTELSSLQKYMRYSVFQELKRDAKIAVDGLEPWWPDSLTGTPGIQMLASI